MKKACIYIFFIGIIGSCSSKQNEDSDFNGNIESFQEYYKFDQSIQRFSILSGKDTVLSGAKGTRILIDRNTFDLPNDEEINIELREFYSLPEIIMAQLSTTSNDKLLETSGMIYLRATDQNSELVLLRNECILEMPKSLNSMSLFYGLESEKGVNWTLSEYDVIDSAVSQNGLLSENKLNQYLDEFKISKLGWINSDKFIEYESKTDVIVDLTGPQTGIQYSLVFHKYNCVLSGVPTKERLIFTGIPADEEVSLIAVASKNEDLYYSMLDFNTDDKNMKFPQLRKSTEENFKRVVSEKFGNDLKKTPEQKK